MHFISSPCIDLLFFFISIENKTKTLNTFASRCWIWIFRFSFQGIISVNKRSQVQEIAILQIIT